MAIKELYRCVHAGESPQIYLFESDASIHSADWHLLDTIEVEYDDDLSKVDIHSYQVKAADKEVMDTRIAHEQAVQRRKDLDCLDYKPADDSEVEP